MNLHAPIQLTRAALPAMIARGGGKIVDVSSMAGASCTPGVATYSATKAGLTHFNACLRAELARLRRDEPGRGARARRHRDGGDAARARTHAPLDGSPPHTAADPPPPSTAGRGRNRHVRREGPHVSAHAQARRRVPDHRRPSPARSAGCCLRGSTALRERARLWACCPPTRVDNTPKVGWSVSLSHPLDRLGR